MPGCAPCQMPWSRVAAFEPLMRDTQRLQSSVETFQYCLDCEWLLLVLIDVD